MRRMGRRTVVRTTSTCLLLNVAVVLVPSWRITSLALSSPLASRVFCVQGESVTIKLLSFFEWSVDLVLNIHLVKYLE